MLSLRIIVKEKKRFKGVLTHSDYKEKSNALNEKYKEQFETITKNKGEEALGSNNKPFTFYKIKLEDFPKEMTVKEMDILIPIIMEE